MQNGASTLYLSILLYNSVHTQCLLFAQDPYTYICLHTLFTMILNIHWTSRPINLPANQQTKRIITVISIIAGVHAEKIIIRIRHNIIWYRISHPALTGTDEQPDQTRPDRRLGQWGSPGQSRSAVRQHIDLQYITWTCFVYLDRVILLLSTYNGNISYITQEVVDIKQGEDAAFAKYRVRWTVSSPLLGWNGTQIN